MSVPEPEKDYPIRLGRSMLPGAERSHFTMRFPNVPDVLDSRASAIQRTGSEINLTANRIGGGCLNMSGVVAMRGPTSTTGEYLLVFHEGVFWLERCSSVIHNVREVDSKDAHFALAAPAGAGAPTGPHDHDAWSPPNFVVSPITHLMSEEEGDRTTMSTPTAGEDRMEAVQAAVSNDAAMQGEGESEKNKGKTVQSENKSTVTSWCPSTRARKASIKPIDSTSLALSSRADECSGSDSGSSQSESESDHDRKQAEPSTLPSVAHKQLATKSLPPRIGKNSRLANEDKADESSSFSSDDSSDSDLDSFTDASSVN